MIVNGTEYRSSVLVPWRGAVAPWPVERFEALDEAAFAALAALKPELVIFGSGSAHRFVSPALLKLNTGDPRLNAAAPKFRVGLDRRHRSGRGTCHIGCAR